MLFLKQRERHIEITSPHLVGSSFDPQDPQPPVRLSGALLPCRENNRRRGTEGKGLVTWKTWLLLRTFSVTQPQNPVSTVGFLKSQLLFQVEIKEAGGTLTSNNPEEATFQNPVAPEPCCKLPSSQEAEDASGCAHKKDANPMVTVPEEMCLLTL